jgi:regulator of protease activity HflC (stomatin/prohibitin superfamily)
MGAAAVTIVTAVLAAVFTLLAVGVVLAAASVRILREYERAVVFRLGRLIGQKGPGLVLLIPGVDRMVRVDLRTVTLDIPPQNLITRDNVPAKVNAVCYFRVIDATRAVVDVEKFLVATSQIAQTILRSVLGKAELDMLLAEREQLNASLQHMIDEHTDPWGIKVTTVEIKDVEIPSAMQRAMALGAEAERERRAKIIHAEGEYQASQRLRDAADVISGNPASLQLRYLQTLTEIGSTQNSTIVFPVPMDVITPFLGDRAPASATEPGERAQELARARLAELERAQTVGLVGRVDAVLGQREAGDDGGDAAVGELGDDRDRAARADVERGRPAGAAHGLAGEP